MSQGGRRKNEGRKGVQFAENEGSPNQSPDFMRDDKDAIRAID